MVRKKTGKKMTLITVHLTDQQIAELDRLVRLHIFPNRSEAIRTAIRELIDKYKDTNPPTIDFNDLIIA